MPTTTHDWTGPDANGNVYSLRSDKTCWSLSALTGAWTQVTNAATIDAVLWFAVAQGGAAARAGSGYSLAACESGGPPPPPPP